MDKGAIRRNIKNLSKRMLKGGRGKALLVLTIPVLFSICFSLLDRMITFGLGYHLDTSIGYLMYDWRYLLLGGMLSIGSFLLSVPLTFGIRDWFIELGYGNKESVGYIFGWFSTWDKFSKALWQTVVIAVRESLWIFLLNCPLIVAFEAYEKVNFRMYGNSYIIIEHLTATRVLFLIAILIANILLSIWLLRYKAAGYILLRHPDKTVRESIGDSIDMMKGHRFEYLVFHLSFIGWVLLIPLTIGFVLLWAIPYICLANALFFQYVEDAYLNPGIEMSFGDSFEINESRREKEDE